VYEKRFLTIRQYELFYDCENSRENRKTRETNHYSGTIFYRKVGTRITIGKYRSVICDIYSKSIHKPKKKNNNRVFSFRGPR